MLCFYSPVIVVGISLTHMRKINFFSSQRNTQKKTKQQTERKKMARKKFSDEAPHTPLSLPFRISVSIDSHCCGIKWKEKKCVLLISLTRLTYTFYIFIRLSSLPLGEWINFIRFYLVIQSIFCSFCLLYTHTRIVEEEWNFKRSKACQNQEGILFAFELYTTEHRVQYK